MTMTTRTARDEQFRQRIAGVVATVKAWDADEDLLKECRSLIPFARLRDNNGPFSRPEDAVLQPSVRFVQRLARFFQNKMTWIDQPPCSGCGSSAGMVAVGMRGPETAEERDGQASRVEVYKCSSNSCLDSEGTTTAFPRYNSVKQLLKTHSGRCGEYANLFGLYCRALGLETRYVHDVTDHVWTEVLIAEGGEERWIMVDSCEGVIDENSMYEAGWGKKLSYVVAVSSTQGAVDVSARYTRRWNDGDFQARRRAITSSEQAGAEALRQINQTLRADMSPKEAEQLERRLQREVALVQQDCLKTAWEHQYGRGRISGALVWKASRQEAGTADGGGKDHCNDSRKEVPSHFNIEMYYPPPSTQTSTMDTVRIAVHPRPRTRHEAVTVSGVACAVGALNSLSVVVLDQEYLGCILQSRCFSELRHLADFVATLPAHRIVAIVGALPDAEVDKSASSKLLQLGGFDANFVKEGVLYVGQVLATPNWAFCCGSKDAPHGFLLEAIKDRKERKLRTEKGVRPAAVVGRLPESIMPLETQKLAGYDQKKSAFLSFIEKEGGHHFSGYTTKPGAPVYLLGETAYPFTKVETVTNGDTWNSFLLLPPPLVPDDDVAILDAATPKDSPQFEVPLDTNFFVRNLGAELLTNGGKGRMPTIDALRNTRLVALYFSAHWCGPCRSFTPMLAEMYGVLKEAYPTHGLEIVFVSSDRDASEFSQYFASVPLLAVPFESLALYSQLLSFTYGVQGIPSLVVLDAMSGQIVAPTTETRQKVQQACNCGQEAIKLLFQTNWLDRVPAESKQVLEMLEISCAGEADQKDAVAASTLLNYHLVRKEFKEAQERINALITQLIDEGMEVDEATEAAKAIEEVSVAEQESAEFEAVPLTGSFQRHLIECDSSAAVCKVSSTELLVERILKDSGRDALVAVLSTALKYLVNCKKAPWTAKFRQFQLSFKVADRITRVTGGILLVQSLGFVVHGTSEDFAATIPIAADLDAMYNSMNDLLLPYSTAETNEHS